MSVPGTSLKRENNLGEHNGFLLLIAVHVEEGLVGYIYGYTYRVVDG